MDNNDKIIYTGGVNPNCDYTHGELAPAIGVKQYCVTRANRKNKALGDGSGFTYCHAPDLAYHNGRYYLQYLLNPRDEHADRGICVLAESEDKIHWGGYRISFPEYKIPKCKITTESGEVKEFSGEEYAFCHHRVCFYKAKNGVFLLSTFYGFCEHHWQTPWDERGIGRVVRRLYDNGQMGDIYFVRPCYNAGWQDSLLNYPVYTLSQDSELVAACREMLANRLYTQQWAEENGDKDDIITIKHGKKQKHQAFCSYHTDENTVVGLWKHSYATISRDGGKSFSLPQKSYSLVMSGQKVWAEKTADGKYAMVYLPTLETQHRYPLAVTTSADGFSYSNMLLVHGEVPPMRYKGLFKDIGPQYVRGIAEYLEKPCTGSMTVAYSVNKEDIWVADIPLPISATQSDDIETDFTICENTLEKYNLYIPKLASIEQTDKGLLICESEPLDYARVSRILPDSICGRVTIRLTPEKAADGIFVELKNKKGKAALRVMLSSNGTIYLRTVTYIEIGRFEFGKPLQLDIEYDCRRYAFAFYINQKPSCDAAGDIAEYRYMAAVSEISRFELRTGYEHTMPLLEEDPEGKPPHTLPQWEEKSDESRLRLCYFSSSTKLKKQAKTEEE